MEGAVFNVQGEVDANITNAELNVNITNSELVVRPASDAVFVVEQAQGATFDVNVTGTANVNIESQTVILDVETEKERAVAGDRVSVYHDLALVSSGNSYQFSFSIANDSALEMITMSILPQSLDQPSNPWSFHATIIIRDGLGNELARIYANIPQFPINFDPGIRIPAGGVINIIFDNVSTETVQVNVSIIVRQL
jgi:hypothetical protein